MRCIAVLYPRRVKIGCMRDRNRARRVAEAPGTPTKERATYESPIEKSCLVFLLISARLIATQRGTQKVHHPSTHVLSLLLFIYTLRGWRESRHNS